MPYDKRNLSAAELQAVECHKWFMSQKLKREVTIEEAIEDFAKQIEAEWRSEKTSKDNLDQAHRIEEMRIHCEKKLGRAVDYHEAAEIWQREHAQIWREERESLEKNGFYSTSAVVASPLGLHMRPTFKLASLARCFDCDVYVHNKSRRMDYYNFIMNGGRRFLSVKSVLGLLPMGAIKGDELEFIACGAKALEALQAIVEFIENDAKMAP